MGAFAELLHVHQVSNSHIECLRELLQVKRRGVPSPLFHLPEVTDGQPGHRETLLGLPDEPSSPSHVLAKAA